MVLKATRKIRQAIPSFGFSGAGFLTCYHLGAAKCLLEHGFFTNNVEAKPKSTPLMTGVSGGALTVAAVAAGVNPEIGMNTTLAVAEQTRQQGFLDSFQPGFSLLDQVERRFLQDIVDAIGGDTELLLRRIEGGNKLRIGLTNRSIQPFVRNLKAYCYVDRYRDAEDIVAACMLSSFIRGVTGPYSGTSPTMVRASKRVREMADLGFIKKQSREGGEISRVTLAPASDSSNSSNAENDNFPPFVDGGLSNGFPIIDQKTVLVTPIRGKFEPNLWICPPPDDQDTAPSDDDLVVLSQRVKLYMNRQNARTFRRIILSSDETELQRRYSQGYDDAKRFLVDHNLETLHTSFVTGVHERVMQKEASFAKP